MPYRRDAFCKGLWLAGYKLIDAIRNPGPDDVLCIWNRYGSKHAEAKRFEAAGARVIVAENGYLGKNWRDGTWFSMALGHHAGAGTWREGGPERWDSWGVELAPWRGHLGEVILLGQRGIGESGIASPDDWAERRQIEYRGRIRPHPGRDRSGESLEDDLRNACAVLTWNSAAALKALMWGIPVFHEHPAFIGAPGALPLSRFHMEPPKRDDAARLACFRRLAWAMFELREIESGAAFEHLLGI